MGSTQKGWIYLGCFFNPITLPRPFTEKFKTVYQIIHDMFEIGIHIVVYMCFMLNKFLSISYMAIYGSKVDEASDRHFGSTRGRNTLVRE
jgi:hypothetical protein